MNKIVQIPKLNPNYSTLFNKSLNSNDVRFGSPTKMLKDSSFNQFSPIKEVNLSETKDNRRILMEEKIKKMIKIKNRNSSQFILGESNTLAKALKKGKIKNLNSLQEKRKSNIFDRVNKHIIENISMEIDPLSFMQNEFEKINQKVIGESTFEMGKMIEKLDLIMNNLHKKK